jgi:hypothetical protein
MHTYIQIHSNARIHKHTHIHAYIHMIGAFNLMVLITPLVEMAGAGSYAYIHTNTHTSSSRWLKWLGRARMHTYTQIHSNAHIHKHTHIHAYIHMIGAFNLMALIKPLVEMAGAGSLNGAEECLVDIKDEVLKVSNYWANVEDE